MAISSDRNAPRSLLERYHQSMLDKDADALAELYALDGVHEFPLLSPLFPRRLNGREEIRKRYGAVWGSSPIRIREIRQIAIHDTSDPHVIVSEAEYTADAGSTDQTFVLSFLIVMHAKEGLIVHLRDYMDTLGAAFALGRLPNLVDGLNRQRPSL
jgi:ketosteroid isomerase-like protein